MALLFMDSFDHYATADIAEKWTSTYGANVSIGAYGRNSTNGMRISNGTCNASATVSAGVTELILSFAMKFTGATPTTGIVTFGSASGWECGLMLQSDYTLRPFRVENGGYTAGHGLGNVTLVGTSSTVALQSGVWAYLEVRMKCDDSAGTCTVRVNGVEVLVDTGLDTMWQSTSLTRCAIGTDEAGPLDIDDLVVMDTTGSLNNSFLGDVTVSAIYPSGAGATSGWTPSAGSNYQCVDETAPNDDTDYNATATLDAVDTYAMTNCSAGAVIKAVQLLASVRKEDVGAANIKLVTRSGGTDYLGTEIGISTTAYAYVREVREVDPATSAAWTESGFNAVEFGMKKTA